MKKLLALLLMAPAIAFAGSDSSDIEYVYRTKGIYCTDWKTIEKVTKNFDEVRIGRGIGQYRFDSLNKEDEFGQVFVYANPNTGTFTIVQKSPSGLWCLLANGENYRGFSTDKLKVK